MQTLNQSPPDRVARTRRRIALVALSLSATAALAACADDVVGATAGPAEQPTSHVSRLADDATIFAITDHGGLGPVEVTASVQPRLVITADGTIYRPASSTDDEPGPVVPQIETTVMDDEDRSAVFAALDDRIEDLTASELPHPGAADAAFTELVLQTDDVDLVQVTVPALAEAGATADASDPVEVAAAELVAEIESIVDDYDDWELRAPNAVRITSISYDEEADPGVGPAVEFPLDGAALAPTEGFGCLDLTDADLDVFMETIKDNEADASTPWMTRGRLFQLIVRPMYSHEAPCGDHAAPAPAEPTPTTNTTAAPANPTTKPPTTKPPTTKPPTTKPPVLAKADGAGCTPGVGALPDGLWFGVVTEAMVDAIDFDLACWFSGDNAIKAATEDGAESPPPNDYYVRNTNPDQRTIKTGADVSVTWYPSAGDPGSETTTGYAEWVEANRDGARVWITIKGGVIVDIDEQWTP